jgi:hydrogenase-4 component B
MAILSVACLVIGLFPDYLVQVAFLGLKNVRVLSLVGAEEVATVTGNLAFAARLFAVVFLLAVLLRKVCYSRKAIDRGPTWGCGFTQPTVRMQYTGTSYAMSIVDFFRPFVQVQTRYSGITRIFPGRTTYETRVEDVAEVTLIDRIITPFVYLLGKFRWIQHGHIQLYIGYIIVTIIALLLFV